MNSSLPCFCPIRGCLHSSSSCPPNPLSSRDQLILHLTNQHHHHLHLANESISLQANLHICPTCPDKIYKSQRGLHHHFATCHLSSRATTNTTICTHQIYQHHKPTISNEWATGLQFIHSNIKPQPAESRGGLRELVKPSLFKSFTKLFNSIVRACNASSSQFVPSSSTPSHPPPEWETSDHPFWWLLFHSELLIFCPNTNEQESNNQCVLRRLNLLAAGHIASLWDEVLQVTSRPPGALAPVQQSERTVNKAAQAAADVDNYRTAYARATSETPVAKIDQQSLNNNVKKLYPSKLPPTNPSSPPPVRSPTCCPSPTSPTFHLRGDIIDTIRQAAKGKAAGFVMDSMDVFIAIAKSNDPDAHSELTAMFTRLFNGHIHESIVPYITSTYLFCLHKDATDPSKLRPIGVPTAIRRLLASHIAKTYRDDFARFLLPYNYAIGVPNGMDFVVKATQLQVDRFITQPQQAGTSPSRCLISLDMKNMFNEISREEIFAVVEEYFPELTHITSLFYAEDGEVWLRMQDGDWSTIAMEEGTNQGCPLSSTIAALVLHVVIQPIAIKLRDRAAQRLRNGDPGDDGLGGISDPMGYVDDMNVVTYLPDVLFFLQEFKRRAAPKGLWLNSSKTRLLTSTSGHSALDSVRQRYGPELAAELSFAIETFSNKPAPTKQDPQATAPVEVTTGLRVLGQPVGSLQFAQAFFTKAIDTVESQLNHLSCSITDKATLMKLFSTCALHKTPHLLGSEVLYSLDEVNPTSWDAWNGPLASRIHHMVHKFLCQLTHTTNIPEESLLIAYIGVAQGGLGFMDPHTRAIPDKLRWKNIAQTRGM